MIGKLLCTIGFHKWGPLMWHQPTGVYYHNCERCEASEALS